MLIVLMQRMQCELEVGGASHTNMQSMLLRDVLAICTTYLVLCCTQIGREKEADMPTTLVPVESLSIQLATWD